MPFFDHMLAQLGKHGLLDLTVQAQGDIEVDAHHTVEDTALALGQALREALGDKAGHPPVRRRAGPAGRDAGPGGRRPVRPPVLRARRAAGMAPLIGSYDTTLTRHIFESLAHAAGICVHVDVLAGRNPHHIVEAQFKAFARALRAAVAPDPRAPGAIPSTKGVL